MPNLRDRPFSCSEDGTPCARSEPHDGLTPLVPAPRPAPELPAIGTTAPVAGPPRGQPEAPAHAPGVLDPSMPVVATPPVAVMPPASPPDLGGPERSGSGGPRLVEILGSLNGTGIVPAALSALWGPEAAKTLTAAQTQAILNVAEARGADALVEAFRAIAEQAKAAA